MIRIRLKEKFENEEEAWRFLLSIVHPGDETHFESTGKPKKINTVNYFEEGLKSLGLEPVE